VRSGAPLFRYISPYQTVCNYATYFFNGLGSHISEGTDSGTAEATNPLSTVRKASLWAPSPRGFEVHDQVALLRDVNRLRGPGPRAGN